MISKTQVNPYDRNRFANTLESLKMTLFHRYCALNVRRAERASNNRFFARGQFHRLTPPVLCDFNSGMRANLYGSAQIPLDPDRFQGITIDPNGSGQLPMSNSGSSKILGIPVDPGNRWDPTGSGFFPLDTLLPLEKWESQKRLERVHLIIKNPDGDGRLLHAAVCIRITALQLTALATLYENAVCHHVSAVPRIRDFDQSYPSRSASSTPRFLLHFFRGSLTLEILAVDFRICTRLFSLTDC